METIDVFLSEYQAEFKSALCNDEWIACGPRTGLLCEAVRHAAFANAEGLEVRIRVLNYAPLNRWLMPV